MQSTLPVWWLLPDRLGGMPKPFIDPVRRIEPAGQPRPCRDELAELQRLGVRALVSLLNLSGEAGLYERAGFVFKCFPVANGYPPTLDQWREFCRFVDEQLAANQPVVVFCEAGLGRTGTVLAAYLIHCGHSPDAAIARVRGVEPAAIESERQMAFLYELAPPRPANPAAVRPEHPPEPPRTNAS